MQSMLPRLGLLLAAAAAPLAQADTQCVHDTAGLVEALRLASLGFNGDTTIKLQRGVYVSSGLLGDGDNAPYENDLSILGGYSDSTCSDASRSLDPSLTVLRAATPGAQDGVLIQIDGNLLLKSLTFRGYGLGVAVFGSDPLFGADDQWTFDRIRIEGSGGAKRGDFVEPGFYVSTLGDADVTLQQVVIANNANGTGFDAGLACSTMIFPQDNAVTVKQSTFAFNAGTGLCLHGDDARADIDNNIFWGNPLGLDVNGVPSAGSHVRYNTIDGNTFEQSPLIDIGNDSLDPQFVDAAGRDYRLLASSPAVDRGILPPTGGTPGSDITGGPRVIGSGIDRGPWETNVDSASVLRVTNTAASGSGSLANAIAQSNALAGTQVIQFAIPGSCPRIITQVQGQPLPDITDNVRIDGYSQPGSVRGAPGERTLCVGIWGNQALPTLLRVPLGADVSLDVSGLGFGGTTFDGGAAAISLFAGGGHQIAGNQFGGAIGPVASPVQLNVLQNGIIAGFGAHDAFIGGFDPEQGNVFNSARASAIDIGATSAQPANFRIYSNYIGLRANGIGTDGNGDGITINNAAGNWVLLNWISGNSGNGIVLKGNGADGNYVLSNDIGRCPLCLAPIGNPEVLAGNGVHGLLVQAGADANIVNGNRIAGNGFGYAEEHGANGNALVGNRVYRNEGLGIDIGRDGVTPNDNGGVSPDGVQNFPVLVAASGDFNAGSVRGALSSAAQQTYTIEVYVSDSCDASGYGEGQRFVGRANVTTPSTPIPGIHSTVNFQIPISSGSLDGRAITALARGPAGDTSEFSRCITYLYSDVIFANGFDGALLRSP